MDFLIKILHAAVKTHWPVALRIFLIGLLCATIYPIIAVVVGIDGDAWSPVIVKIILALACIATGIAVLWQWQWIWHTLPQWWRCSIPLLGIAAIMLLCGVIPSLRSLGVGLGLIMGSIGVFVIAVYAFSGRLLYAAIIEAPSSADVDLADAEIHAKELFRTLLAVLAWEWFGAWYLTTFSPQMTVTIGTFAFFSLGIVALTSYSLGYKGETGAKILMYGALIALILISLILLDRMVEQGDMTTFLTSGYFGSQLKTVGTPASKIGVVGWIAILLFLDLAGVAIAWKAENELISKLTFAVIATIGVYLTGSWIVAEGFSIKKSIEILTAFIAPNVKNLSGDVALAFTLGGIVGVIMCVAGAMAGIKKGDFPAWSITGLSLFLFILYQIVFVK